MTASQIETLLKQTPPPERLAVATRLIALYLARQDDRDEQERAVRRRHTR